MMCCAHNAVILIFLFLKMLQEEKELNKSRKLFSSGYFCFQNAFIVFLHTSLALKCIYFRYKSVTVYTQQLLQS